MNTDLTNILSSDPTVAAIGSLLDSKDAANASLAGQVSTLQTQESSLQGQVTNQTAQIAKDATDLQAAQAQAATLGTQLSQLQTQLTAASLSAVRSMTANTGMHMWPAKTTDNKEALGVWIDSGGHTAQSNPGTSTIPHGTFTWTQGTATTPARLNFTPGGGWDDIYIYERFPLPAALPTFVSDRRTFSLTAADRAVINCIEWQQQFTSKGKTYNCAWQWNFGAKMFRYFDYGSKTWKQVPGVPWIDLGATPITVITEHQLDAVHATEEHLAISINGTRYAVGIIQPATDTPTSADKYTVSLCQLDSDGKGDPFGINIHDAAAFYL